MGWRGGTGVRAECQNQGFEYQAKGPGPSLQKGQAVL